MEHYKNDLANNIISLASAKAKGDPKQADDELFKAYFKNILAPGFEKQYGKKITYGKYHKIVEQAKKAIV
jgi:hypothetical protein